MRILFPHYAKYIWATSMPVAVMNVPTFAENLVREYISFLLRSIPLTTKLWFKIHKHLKSPASLSEILWSSDAKHLRINEQRCSHSAPFVRLPFWKIRSTANKGWRLFPTHRGQHQRGKDLQAACPKSHSSRCSLNHTSTPVCLGLPPRTG